MVRRMAQSDQRNPSLAIRQGMELKSWRDAKGPRDPLGYDVNTLVNAPVLLDLLDRYAASFQRATDVLELGAGQGWASCIVKRRFPELRVTASDFSPDAIASIAKWERIFEVRVDNAVAVPSYDTRRPDASFDLVFAFASAHHFVLHRRTFDEMAQILRPGGEVLYLYEPTVRDWLYRAGLARIRKTRTDVVEDMLRQDELQSLARGAGLSPELDLYPTMDRRSPLGTIYNAVLIRVPPLRRILWCTANFRFVKPAG